VALREKLKSSREVLSALECVFASTSPLSKRDRSVRAEGNGDAASLRDRGDGNGDGATGIGNEHAAGLRETTRIVFRRSSVLAASLFPFPEIGTRRARMMGVARALIDPRGNQPMRLRRFHLSVRFLLAAIGVIATAMAILIAEAKRRQEYWDRLNYHFQQLEGSSPPLAMGFFQQLPEETQARYIKAWMYHSAMAQKYKTALSVPLFYVPDDP
jgi:hypothetical protein